MPFKANELQTVPNTILLKFIKSSVLDAATCITMLSKINVLKKVGVGRGRVGSTWRPTEFGLQLGRAEI